MFSNKQQLRTRVLDERDGFSEKFIKEVSEKIAEKLQKLPIWEESQKVHIYLPIPSKNEIDTRQLIGWLLNSEDELWTSYLSNNESEDGFCKITKKTRYKAGRYDTLLPSGKVMKTIQPDVIIVPCVAADMQGIRLGYGLGWYDRFLAKQPKALKIGLVYDQLLFDQIPSEAHDQKLDVIVSEERIIHTKRI